MKTPQPDDKQARRPGVSPIVVIAIVAALVVFPAVGFMAFSVLRTLSARNASGSNNIAGTSPAPAQIQPWQGTERLNVLLLGIDQRPDDNPDVTRTDTMIVLTLDPATRSAGMLSIPRDLYVTIPGRGQDRINTAHVFGGPALAMKTVSANFGIPIQHYARVNFNVLVTLVDRVGGIDVKVDEDINDPLYPDMNYGYDPFVISAGMHHMDGATALKYARTRHGASDFFRMRRQQQIIMALRDRVFSTDAITRLLPNMGQIWDSLQRSISTDLSLTEILQLLFFAKDLSTDRITRVVIDETSTQNYVTPQGADVLIPVQSRIKELRAQLYTPPPQLNADKTPEPGRITIQNGTSIKGLAASVQTRLQSKGYKVVSVSDAQGLYAHTVIIDYRGNAQLMQQLAGALGVSMASVSTSLDANNPVDALVILGDDYSNK